MSNVVSMQRSCEYMVRRAAARRRSGCYDEAMTLLTKARDQFGFNEEIELEMARTYDEIGCEEEAARSYLRIVRVQGKHRAEALFHLALSSAQRGDIPRAMSYFEPFVVESDHSRISQEMAQLLGHQLREELERPLPSSAKGRSGMLIRRAIERLQKGKTAAAKRTLHHALSLYPSVRGHVMLACCFLLRGEYEDAVRHASIAHKMAPAQIQTLCVLTDAHASAGNEAGARRSLMLAALRAKNPEDRLNVAIESAKRGEDRLTLLLTRSVLKREPFETRAMTLRACAFVNLGRYKDASRLFGRLCGLLPENTVCEAFYKMVREGEASAERLTLGLEVTRKEGVSRATQLLAALYIDPEQLREDKERERALCRMAAWSFRSALAGDQVATVALLLMSAVQSDASREVLLDALTDPQVDDTLKCKIIQIMSTDEDMARYPVDMGGRLVRLAAGKTTTQSTGDSELCREIVQRASDVLGPGFKDAPSVMLEMWIGYLRVYDAPARKQAAVCAAALEYAYHVKCGRAVNASRIAQREGVSVRLCRFYAKRLLRCDRDKNEAVSE